jgi:putative selenate reductase molybdopterin-binding subunit
MKLHLDLNGEKLAVDIKGHESLLSVLRDLGYSGVKSGGCKRGECGACTVLMDGKAVNSCMFLALQAEGHRLVTIEAEGQRPNQAWKESQGLSTLQQAFVENGSVQCGYCTPAMVLAAKALLDKEPDPSEEQVREALSGVLCRCTAYVKPVQAILNAAKTLKASDPELQAIPFLKMVDQDPIPERSTVGKSEIKIDASKLVQGKPAFTADMQIPGTLYAAVLRSPVAHARIRRIDVEKAKALPGVAAVLTWQDLPRVVYSTAGQNDPIPGPLDMFSLDQKVRFVGDRVAFVAAETLAIAEEALTLIEVNYEEIPAILDPRESLREGSPVIHDEPEYVNFGDSDPSRNLAAKIRIDIGNVDQGFEQADRIFEQEYVVPKVQQAHIEPHVALTYWDEDDRLVIRSSTQVPFHVRRMIAPVLGLPIKRIRVVKPRIGGGFGNKQEMLMEDVAAHLTIATGRPVLYEMTREEEFIASRARHPMRVKMRTGVKLDGTMTANEMVVLSDTGAYGCHALTVAGNTGQKSMALYVGDGEFRKSPNIRFYADIVYTNTPPSGAYRGYGVPQGFWPLERHMEMIAREMGWDALDFRLKNSIQSGEYQPFSTAWNEGREPVPEVIHTVGLAECVRQGRKAIDWDSKYQNPEWRKISGKPHLSRGIGVALVMQGTAIPYLDMGGASLKINEDGSFNLLVGATDLGTGSDTVLAQMAAEKLGVPVDDILMYSSDTDFTPFDKGAYASSTTYISGTAGATPSSGISATAFAPKGCDFS